MKQNRKRAVIPVYVLTKDLWSRKAGFEFCKELLVTYRIVYLHTEYNFTVFDFVCFNGAFSATCFQ
jgi:hypothetical protein